jgi:hypothetical protein
LASAGVEPGIPEGLLVLELVPGLLDGAVFDAAPVVLPEPVLALFSCTLPLASRQCVAAEMVDEGDAPGLVVAGGGDVVCAPAVKISAALTMAAPIKSRVIFTISSLRSCFVVEVRVAHSRSRP